MNSVFIWLLPYIIFSISIGLLAGTVGSYIFLRRLSGIVGGLAHFSLGPIALAHLLNVLFSIQVSPFLTSIVAMGIVALLLPVNDEGIIVAEHEIQILWSVGMAIGLLIMFLLPGYLSIEEYLFGSILTISTLQIIIISIISLLVLLIEVILHNRFKFLNIDDEFLRLRGIKPILYHRLQLFIIIITINILLQGIGILLMLAILIIPIASAVFMTTKTELRVILAIVISVFGLVLGLLLSYFINLPISALVTLVFAVLYVLFRIVYLCFIK